MSFFQPVWDSLGQMGFPLELQGGKWKKKGKYSSPGLRYWPGRKGWAQRFAEPWLPDRVTRLIGWAGHPNCSCVHCVRAWGAGRILARRVALLGRRFPPSDAGFVLLNKHTGQNNKNNPPFSHWSRCWGCVNQQPAAIAAQSPGHCLPAAAAGSGVICTEKFLGKRRFPFAGRGKGHQVGTVQAGEPHWYHGSCFIAAVINKSPGGKRLAGAWWAPGMLRREEGLCLPLSFAWGMCSSAHPLWCWELLCEVAAAAPAHLGECRRARSSLQISILLCCHSSGASQHPGANSSLQECPRVQRPS